MTTLFEVTGVSKRYPGSSRPALDGIHATVEEGEHLGIVGESGSGKTTLSRVMLGLLAPSAGEVRYRGAPVSYGRGRSTRDFRSRVQLVLQDPYSSLSPRLTVAEIVAEPLRILGRTAGLAARVAELLAGVELDPLLAGRLPHELSGGQRQRVAIARALSVRPEVIVADEPLSALDVSVREQVLVLLRRLARDEGLTLVIVSHDLGVVQRLCPRAMVMSRGRAVESGATARLLERPTHPYTRELIASIPRLPERTS